MDHGYAKKKNGCEKAGPEIILVYNSNPKWNSCESFCGLSLECQVSCTHDEEKLLEGKINR